MSGRLTETWDAGFINGDESLGRVGLSGQLQQRQALFSSLEALQRKPWCLLDSAHTALPTRVNCLISNGQLCNSPQEGQTLGAWIKIHQEVHPNTWKILTLPSPFLVIPRSVEATSRIRKLNLRCRGDGENKGLDAAIRILSFAHYISGSLHHSCKHLCTLSSV